MRQRSYGNTGTSKRCDGPFERRDRLVVAALLLEADAHPQVGQREIGVHLDRRSTLDNGLVIAPREQVNPRDVMVHHDRQGLQRLSSPHFVDRVVEAALCGQHHGVVIVGQPVSGRCVVA